MDRVSRGALLVTLLASSARPCGAQADEWHSLPAPTATFEISGLNSPDDRPQRMLRLIRMLYSVPNGHKSVEPVQRNLVALLTDINALLDAVEPLPQGTVTLSLAPGRQTREALAAAGLRVRERKQRFVVELDTDAEAVVRRERLALAGIDAAAAVETLNAGESVRFSPLVADIPLPLAPETWSSIVFQQPVSPRALFGRILTDRSASLLYYGLCGMTDETREFLRRTPDLLRWVYRERSGTFAAYGSSLRVVNGRVDVPGGEGARPLWEALVGEPVSKPIEFFKQVLGRDDGRLAYLYESIDMLEGPAQRFALGLATTDAGVRVERFGALYQAFVGIEAEWSHLSVPFARPMYDAAMLLQIARVTPDGTLAGPASRGLWRMAFDSPDFPVDPVRAVRDVGQEGALDAAGAAELVVLAPARYRRERFEAFAFGQRVFGAAPDEHLGDVLVALRAFARFPAVMLTLDRLGVTSAPLYASIARHARAIERIDDPNRQIPVQAQFQGALAMLDRLTRTGQLSAGTIEPLLTSLVATSPDGSRGYDGRVARWIERSLLPALGRTDASADSAFERRLVAGLADTERDADRRFEWEGLAYDVSVAAAERRRLEATRVKQGGNSLDAVLAFSGDVAALTERAFTVDRVKPTIASLKEHAGRLAPGRPWAGMNDDEVPDLRTVVGRAINDLGKIKQPRHASKAVGVAEPLTEMADYLLGEVLVALAYAPFLGDPANLVGGAADVAHKHDFGAGTAVNDEARKRTPWLRPRQPTGATVVGAVLGLDLALAHHGLRRLVSDRVPELPRLNTNNRDVFTTTVALMNPRHLRDADLRRVVTAVRAGRHRVAEARSDLRSLDQLAATARMSASRRQLLAWTARHDTRSISDLFSITELLALGDPAEAGSGREVLGLTEEPLTGCYCRRFPLPGPWETYSGRLGSGQLATRVPDLALRVTELLDELNVPAALLPSILSLATQDFIDEVPALYADDWPAAIGHAKAVSRERVEDYISSLTAGGPLRPVSSNQQ